MNEIKLLSTILPSHPDFLNIINNIRKKYDIPEISPEDDGITEILLDDNQIDWDAVRQDIENQLRAIPEILPPGLFSSLQNLKAIENQPLNFPELDELRPELKEQIIKTLTLIMSLIQPLISFMPDYYKFLSDMMFECIVTGKTRDIPPGWISQVQTLQMFGYPVIFAIAGQMADPKLISEEFRKEFNKTFGDKPRLSEENLNSAEYLRMKLEGKPLRDILDIYIQRNPGQFPNPKSTKSYARAKKTHLEKLRKRIQRLQKTFNKMMGDK